jgi:hypothetical protein
MSQLAMAVLAQEKYQAHALSHCHVALSCIQKIPQGNDSIVDADLGCR